MPSNFTAKPPVWFWIAAIVLLLWGAMGCYACYMQFKLGAEAWGDPGNAEYNRALYASLPSWYNYIYAAAVGFGLLGVLALLARKAIARPLFIISLIAVVIQFGYAFFLTDMVVHKGAAAVVPFPLLVIAIGVVEVWLAGYAIRRRWIR